jgi:hypothetical protein
MFNILEQLKIDFKTEYSPEWIKPMRYDFYFKLYNQEYIIEMDGGLGHGNIIHSKSNKTKEETLKIDNYKDEQAKLHSIEIIRIDCQKSELEYIKNSILNSGLDKIYNLKKIDWNKCEEFALSNRVKEICELKKNNPELTTVEIGEIMRLNRNTVLKYLTKGSKIWNWVNYDGTEERTKAMNKAWNISSKICGKQVEIFKEGKSLGVFNNCHELSRQSEELFNIKLDFSAISRVCRNKKKQYKGYTFKYI